MENRTHGFAIQEDARTREKIEREAELELEKELTLEEYTTSDREVKIDGIWPRIVGEFSRH